MTAAPPTGGLPRRLRPAWPALAAVVLVAGALASLTEWWSWSFAPGPAALVCLGVAAFAVAGLLLWWEGDQRGNALLIWFTGLLFMADKALAWPATPLIMLGQWFGWLYLVTLAVVLLRYPSTRLTAGLRTVIWVITIGLLVPRTVVILSRRGVDQIWPVSTPPSGTVVQVWWPTVFADASVAVLAERVWLLGSVAAAIVVLVLMRRRLRRARPMTQRELAVLWPALLTVAAVAVARLAILAWIPPSMAEEEFSAELQAVTVLVIPLVLVVGAVRRRGQRARVADLVHALEPPATPEQIQAALRETLGDPDLQVYYRTDGIGQIATGPPPKHRSPYDKPSGNDGFVNEDGASPRHPPHPGRILQAVTVRDGGPQALVDLARELRDRHPELTGAALSAASLAIANARLQVELRLQLDEVVASRARIAQAGLQERRRLERDLHDGVQQRLLSIGALLGRLSLQPLSPEVEPLVRQARDSLREARSEVSEVARGLHPGVLTQGGLRAAVDSVTERLPITVHTEIPDQRWPSAVEATAYYVICEALTNVVKHAHTYDARVLVTHQTGALQIEVYDHGEGGATTQATGTGLVGIRDRVTALGGEMTILSRTDGAGEPAPPTKQGWPGPNHRDTGGTTIQVRLPCE